MSEVRVTTIANHYQRKILNDGCTLVYRLVLAKTETVGLVHAVIVQARDPLCSMLESRSYPYPVGVKIIESGIKNVYSD